MKAAALEQSRTDWLEDAVALIHSLAATNDTVTADDIRAEMREPGNPNWAGVAFTVALERGYITSVGRKPSTYKSRKGARIDVWAAVRNES